MNDLAIARAIYVLAVVVWIGGVAMVTTVIQPMVRRARTPTEGQTLLEAVERRFAWQARVMTLLAGATGFYMVARLDLWSSFLMLRYWWLDAMLAIWLLFTFMLFIAEPLFLDRWFALRARQAPEQSFALIQRLHWALLLLSLVTLLGAVAGSHGLSFFG